MNTRNFQEAVASINKEIDKLASVAGNVNAPKNILEQIIELKNSASGDSFKVLVIGEFSSGKSTMINALLGEPILPERATTATAIITEIRYGETKKAVIFPKEGRWQGGDAPFEVPIKDLRQYLLIDHRSQYQSDDESNNSNLVDGNVIDSPFKKMELYWPLEILKDGVEIVDSPGINDPTCYGLVANEYLSKVHAIIYLMSGLAAGKKTDFDEIEELRKRDFKTPIFVITRYDNVVEDAENQYDPEEYLRDYRDTIIHSLKNHTDLYRKEYQDKLGADGIFFVSSKQAKEAKRAVPMNQELYVNSGYAKFERYLGDYLVKCKGEEQLKSIQSKFNLIANDVINMMSEQLRAADTPLDEFNAKIKDVQKKLEIVNRESELFVKQFNMELDNMIVNDILPLTPSLLSGAREQIDAWAKGFDSSVEYSFLHPKRSAEAIATECQAYFERCYEDYQIQWVKEKLIPQMEQSIKQVAKRLEERSKRIDQTLKDIKLSLNFVSDADSETSSTSAKVTSVIYGLLTLDVFGASAGFNSGFSGLVKGIVTNVLINLTLMCVLGTVSLPIFIVAEVVNALIVGFNQKKTMINKIAKKVAAKYDEALSSSETLENVRTQLKTGVQGQLVELKKAAKDAAFADIQLVETEIKQLADEKKKGEKAVQEHKAKLTNNIEMVGLLINNVNKIHNTIA